MTDRDVIDAIIKGCMEARRTAILKARACDMPIIDWDYENKCVIERDPWGMDV